MPRKCECCWLGRTFLFKNSRGKPAPTGSSEQRQRRRRSLAANQKPLAPNNSSVTNGICGQGICEEVQRCARCASQCVPTAHPLALLAGGQGTFKGRIVDYHRTTARNQVKPSAPHCATRKECHALPAALLLKAVVTRPGLPGRVRGR